MSDDYDDDDEPGGLWDPDAFTPPSASAPPRPALHIVATPDTADGLDRRVDATTVSEEADQHTLVRLEQFRTVSDGHGPQRSPASSPTLRRAAAAGVLASVVAAIAIAYGTLSSAERFDLPASTPRAAAVLAVDSEHAAATREVASADSRARSSRQPKSRTRQHTQSKRRSAPASRNHSAPPAQSAPTASSSHAPATSTTTTAARTAAPTAHHQTPVASATSEFGFEG
jgi:hypothetical protein